MVIIAILIGLCAGAAIFFLLDHFSIKKLPTQQFKREQEKAIQGLVEKKNAVEKEFNEDIERRHKERKEQLEREYNRQKESAEDQLLNLNRFYSEQQATIEQSYKKRENELKWKYEQNEKELNEKVASAAQARQAMLEKEIVEEQHRLNTELAKLNEDYKEKKEALSHDFFVVSEQINTKKAELNKELEAYQQKQEAIIARFKADEEKKSNLDFYRIKVNEIEKADIAKLKSLSISFSRPEVLYKVMYEVYYKARLEELFKRVLGENKNVGGIYKITNINNQKVYIGKSTNLLNRWRTHAKRGCGIERISGQLYDAMFEEGLENYTWEIVEICPKEEQTEKEKYWIGFYKSNVYGYNQRTG